MKEDKEGYFARARSWASDADAKQQSALRFARFVAAAAALVAVLEALALIFLTPLKSVSPIPVLVDRQTGFVQVLRPDGREALRADTALTRSLLAQYVIAREGFDITNVASEFHKVALWSDGEARKSYLETMPASNPKSPFRIYPRSTIVDVTIKSVSPLGPEAALVRFQSRRTDQDGRANPGQQWASVVTYRFTNAPMSVADRLINPLGFQVVRYHRDAETIPEANVAPTEGALASPAQAPLPPVALLPAAAAKP